MGPPWFDARADLVRAGELPDRADVVVVGGGRAGLGVAAFLAERGVDVCVLEARSHLLDGASGRGPGLVLSGLAEAPHRLAEALGEEGARGVYRFTQENA